MFVEGAEPGDAPAIDILEIRVDDWGYSGETIYELQGGYIVFDDTIRSACFLQRVHDPI